mmetsp:Transcript_24063/g.48712  ORF Transcript_24063/g.48712 Transcript_24063/m.48712 type:complete len:83 (+) Transcript_24063:255-503(+)
MITTIRGNSYTCFFGLTPKCLSGCCTSGKIPPPTTAPGNSQSQITILYLNEIRRNRFNHWVSMVLGIFMNSKIGQSSKSLPP